MQLYTLLFATTAAATVVMDGEVVAATGTAVQSTNDAQTCAAVEDRVDCSSGVGARDSNFNMTEALCVNRGCCFDDSASASSGPVCFYPTEGKDIEVRSLLRCCVCLLGVE